MGVLDEDELHRREQKRIDKVRNDQERTIKDIIMPHKAECCEVCMHYQKVDDEKGFCILLKKHVRATDWCQHFNIR